MKLPNGDQSTSHLWILLLHLESSSSTDPFIFSTWLPRYSSPPSTSSSTRGSLPTMPVAPATLRPLLHRAPSLFWSPHDVVSISGLRCLCVDRWREWKLTLPAYTLPLRLRLLHFCTPAGYHAIQLASSAKCLNNSPVGNSLKENFLLCFLNLCAEFDYMIRRVFRWLVVWERRRRRWWFQVAIGRDYWKEDGKKGHGSWWAYSTSIISLSLIIIFSRLPKNTPLVVTFWFCFLCFVFCRFTRLFL